MTNSLIIFFSIVCFAFFCVLIAYDFALLGLPFGLVALLGAFIIHSGE